MIGQRKRGGCFLDSLAGTGDRTRCPHHLLQPGWELGKLATGAGEAIWRAQSPHLPASPSSAPSSRGLPNPAAGFQELCTHAAFGAHQTTSKWPLSLPGCGAGTLPCCPCHRLQPRTL